MRTAVYTSILIAGTTLAGVGGVVQAAPAQATTPIVQAHPSAAVDGISARWHVTLANLREMARIPHAAWSGYANNLHFYVVTFRFTNTGTHAAAPYADLDLVMRMDGTPGWRPLDRRIPVFSTMTQAAARAFGGALPWTTTAPGHTTLYCYVFGVRRGESHYGLYTYSPTKGYVFLFPMGV